MRGFAFFDPRGERVRGFVFLDPGGGRVGGFAFLDPGGGRVGGFAFLDPGGEFDCEFAFSCGVGAGASPARTGCICWNMNSFFVYRLSFILFDVNA